MKTPRRFLFYALLLLLGGLLTNMAGAMNGDTRNVEQDVAAAKAGKAGQ